MSFYVQSNIGLITGGGTVSFSSDVTDGNFLLAVAYTYVASGAAIPVTSISDTIANAWNALAPVLINNNTYQQVWWTLTNTSGPNGVTFVAPAGLVCEGIIVEYQNVNAIDIIQQVSSSGTSWNSGNATSNYATELLVGIGVGTSATPGTLTVGSGFTSRQNSTGTYANIVVEDQSVLSTGSYAATVTDTASDTYNLLLLSLYEATPPYDTAEYVLQLARIFINDAGSSAGLSGSILSDNQPYTLPLLNERYRYLQDRLITAGVETFSKYGYVYGLTVNPNALASTQVKLTYADYFDGQTFWPTVHLPVDLLKPLELWEQIVGGQTWVPMKQASDSISSRSVQPRFSLWDYENETLFLPAASQTNNLKIKYLCYAPDLVSTSSLVLVPRCQTALAKLVACEVAKNRGAAPPIVAQLQSDADNAINMISNRTARKESYATYVRQPFRTRQGSRRARF